MRFITTVYGDNYLAMLWVHLQSIANYHPDTPVSVFYEDISEHEIKILQERFPNYRFIQGPNLISVKDLMKKIPLKLGYWSVACDAYPDEVLCLLDCDTALCSNISSFIDESFDVLYTYKDEGFPLNTGVLIVKSKSNVHKFMKYWLKCVEEIIANPMDLRIASRLSGAADQHALVEILNTQNYDGFIEKDIEGEIVKFKGVACKYLNETNSAPITEDTHIIHYKAGWHPIILENAPFTKNRPQEACKEMLDYWQKLYREVTINSVRLFIMASCLKHKEKFVGIVEGYEEHGILHSEMLAVCSVIQNLDIDLVVESGRYKGQSTEILAKYFTGTKTKIVSIEINKDENAKYVENKLKNYSNLKLMYSDANYVIPKILAQHRGKRVAILFDGPKGEKATKIFERAICDFPEVIAGFFHDMRKSSERMANPVRAIMENSFNRVWFTDDNEYVATFGYLDHACLPKNNTITEHSWRPWMKGNNKIGSYGPTLAVVLPVPKERLLKISNRTIIHSVFKFDDFLRHIKSILRKILGKRISHLISNMYHKAIILYYRNLKGKKR